MRVPLTLVLVLAVASCTSELPTTPIVDDAKQDVVNLSKKPFWATTSLNFNLGVFADVTKPSWVGTITSDGTEYGIVFYTLGAEYRGPAFHFEERVEIYTSVNFDFATQTLDTGDLLIWGFNSGLVAPNNHWVANGVVEEAFDDFSTWEGRPFQFSGEVTYHPDGYPISAAGSFRVN